VELGKQMLQDQGADLADARYSTNKSLVLKSNLNPFAFSVKLQSLNTKLYFCYKNKNLICSICLFKYIIERIYVQSEHKMQ
jgi:hypothetical protein